MAPAEPVRPRSQLLDRRGRRSAPPLSAPPSARRAWTAVLSPDGVALSVGSCGRAYSCSASAAVSKKPPAGVVELLHDHLEQLLGTGQPGRSRVDRRQPYRSKGEGAHSPPGCRQLRQRRHRERCAAAGRLASAICQRYSAASVATANQSGRPKIIAACTSASTSNPFQAATTLSSRPGRER